MPKISQFEEIYQSLFKYIKVFFIDLPVIICESQKYHCFRKYITVLGNISKFVKTYQSSIFNLPVIRCECKKNIVSGNI